MIETRTVHEQLLDLCQRDLATGNWPVGTRFPSERELAEIHGISRTTANKVLAKLVSEGSLELRKGLGAFVAERPTLFASLRRIESFTDFAAEQGFKPGTEVVCFKRNASPPPEKTVRVDPATSWIYIERLRTADGDIVIFERRWLPTKRYPRLTSNALKGSFFELCRSRYGLHVEREEASIRAVPPPSEAALEWDAPALRLRGSGFDSGGELLWAQELFYRGDRFTLYNNAESSATLPELGLRLS